MLTKLVSIKNVRRFRNSAAPGDTQLRRLSFIVGPNGYGKTTLRAIFRSLKTGDPTIVIGRKTLGTTAAPEGLSQTLIGAPTCCKRPACITAMRLPMTWPHPDRV